MVKKIPFLESPNTALSADAKRAQATSVCLLKEKKKTLLFYAKNSMLILTKNIKHGIIFFPFSRMKTELT